MAKYYHGQWKAICDVCGWRLPISKLKKRWDGQLVCEADWETDHPQKYIQVDSDPKPLPPDMVRKEAPDQFVAVCTAYTSQAIPGIAIPGCAIPSLNNNLPYSIYGNPG